MPSKTFSGVINLDIRDSVPDWEPYAQPKAPAGTPNVLFIVWDDTGFGAWETFGGPIEVPSMKRLADKGLRYSQFHTTAICSPTRAAMLTGRNHTTVGMACIAEATEGFPGMNGHIPFETATIAEVLGEIGWSTPTCLASGHCVAEDDVATKHGLALSRNCTAGRAAFITGQNPIRTGLTKVGLPGADVGLQADDPTIADLLKPLGYAQASLARTTSATRILTCPPRAASTRSSAISST